MEEEASNTQTWRHINCSKMATVDVFKGMLRAFSKGMKRLSAQLDQYEYIACNDSTKFSVVFNIISL